MWTIERVRKEKPDIEVIIGDKTINAFIDNCSLNFASVYSVGPINSLVNSFALEYSLIGIVNCLNNKIPLKIF